MRIPLIVFICAIPLFSTFFNSSAGSTLTNLILFMLMHNFLHSALYNRKTLFNCQTRYQNGSNFISMKEKSWKSGYLVSNITLFIFLIFLIEKMSFTVILFYQKYQEGFNSSFQELPNIEIKHDIDINPYTDEKGLRRDMDAYKGPVFSSYTSYKNRPYSSEYLNIDTEGIRVNKSKATKDIGDKEIWIFGSSAIYGATNPDNETVPAELEKILEQNKSLNYKVINMAVDGYNSLQDYLYFKTRWLRERKNLIW